MLKKLGVIGGMGPAATSFYYAKVIAETKADRDQEHIDMIILSHAAIPDRTEAILTGQSAALLQAVTKDAVLLEQLGVSNIAIPCNTSHCFFKEIQMATRVPLINMVEESIRCVRTRYPHVQSVGILGTDGTIKAGVYQRACEAEGIKAVVPRKTIQSGVMPLIYDDIKRGKRADHKKFEQAYGNLMEQGCQAVLLACTELSVFKEQYPVPHNCIDTMDVLVRESILRSGAQIR